MTEPKVYLSHGGGVNSWALYLWLVEQGQTPGRDFEAVFVHHGCDWPDTYMYLLIMESLGYPVTVIFPEAQGHWNLYEYSKQYKILPCRQRRWCTDKFKLQASLKYYQRPCVALTGFDAGEAGRMERQQMFEDEGITYDYPLIAEGIDRQGCIDLIQRHGLPVPPKSGCYICPFQGRSDWIKLRAQKPELFCKAKTLEITANDRRSELEKDPIYFRDMPLDDLIQLKDSRGRRVAVGQTEMFDSHDRPPCRCGL